MECEQLANILVLVLHIYNSVVVPVRKVIALFLLISEAPPSFCAMGNAIRSVIAQGGGQEDEGQGEECVLLSEEHSLVLTCCWVSFKVSTDGAPSGNQSFSLINVFLHKER